MRPSSRAIFAELASEALWDATRRRIVPMIALVSLISLLGVDSCTSCASGSITANDEVVPVSQVAGWTGMVVISSLSLWMMLLAGILASDHLAEPLSDGSASLVLSRPVTRGAFAGAPGGECGSRQPPSRAGQACARWPAPARRNGVRRPEH